MARLRPQAAILTVVLAVCLLAATLLATLAVLVDTSERYGVRTALGRSTTADRQVDVFAGLDGQPLPAALDRLQRRLDAALAGAPHEDRTTLRSDVFAVKAPPPLDGSEYGWLTYLADYDGLTGTATLLSGSWPAAPAKDGPVPVAVPERLATDMHLRPGARLAMKEPAGSRSAQVVVTGVYRPPTRRDPRVWGDDDLDGAQFAPDMAVPHLPRTTASGYGPLVAPREAFLDGRVATRALHRAAVPDLSAIDTADLEGLRARAAAVDADLPRELSELTERAAASTELDTTLARVQRYLTATGGSIAVTALLLLVLSLAALLLAGRLLAERRLTEQSLMRARGASGRQVLLLAAVETVLLTGLVAAVAPVLARGVYRLLARRTDAAAAGLDVDPGLPRVAWVAAGAACAVFAVVLLLPLLRGGRTFVESEQSRARQDRRTAIQRSGLDLALVALAAVGYAQLRSYRSPLAGPGAGGGQGLDPVLVAGPALALLGGALVTVRIVPAIARLLELVAARGRRLVAPLAAWEVGRRSRRAVGAVLLLALAFAVGTFGLSFLRTWQVSQTDQADFQVGADARVRVEEGADVLSGARRLAAVPGAERLLPVIRTDTTTGPVPDENAPPFATDGPATQLVAVDARHVGALLRGRELGPGGASRAALAALPSLAATEPLGALPVPGSPTAVSARVTITPSGAAALRAARLRGTVRLVLQDGTGARQPVMLGSVLPDGKPQVLTARLVPEKSQVTPPLSIVAVQTQWVTRTGQDAEGMPAEDGADGADGADAAALEKPLEISMTVDQVRFAAGPAATTGAAPLVLGPPLTWTPSTTLDAASGSATGSGQTLLAAHLEVPGYLTRFAGAADIVFTTWRPASEPVVAVAAGGLLEQLDVAPRDAFVVRVGQRSAKVAARTVVPYLPGLDPARPQLLVDYDALTRSLVEQGGETLPVTEWWAKVPDDRAAAWAAEVTARGEGTATSRAGLGLQLQRQPLRVGIVGALWLVTLAAAALAGTGFAMHTTVAVRLRRVEFSQLRALGVPRRTLNGVVWAESGLLGLLGVGCGVGLGTLLALLVAPMVSLAAEGARPVPEVLVHIPWSEIGLLALAVCGGLAGVLLVVTRVLRGSALGSVLRLGDER